jgi:hypothetical protein
MSTEAQGKEYLKAKYGKYMTPSEEPIREFSAGFYKAVATNRRIVFLRKLPTAFIPVLYTSIINIEHYVYVSWDMLARSLILLGIAAYAYTDSAGAMGLLDSAAAFFKKNVPELAGIASSILTKTLLDVLIMILPLMAAVYMLKFTMSLSGRLKIAVKGASPLRIDTPLTGDVQDLIKFVETSMEGGDAGASAAMAEEAELEAGHTYLVKEYKPQTSLNLFIKAIFYGCKGVYLSRTNPVQIREEHRSDVNFQIVADKIAIYWLTDSLMDGKSISPEPEQLFAFIGDFIEKNDQTVVLLDGLEYLISHSNFEQVLRFIQGLNDKVGVRNSRLIVPISPQSLSEKEMALLGREMSKVL